ncbi:hypothetical protein J6590_079163 [Homalodisca vitripennis]|nr:hypothetical protein J6590_069384 [Homalodisca vitripennis]KAG8329780.1 hypothetical protein J6590_079163 [Homalodisca vitripennis]
MEVNLLVIDLHPLFRVPRAMHLLIGRDILTAADLKAAVNQMTSLGLALPHSLSMEIGWIASPTRAGVQQRRWHTSCTGLLCTYALIVRSSLLKYAPCNPFISPTLNVNPSPVGNTIIRHHCTGNCL